VEAETRVLHVFICWNERDGVILVLQPSCVAFPTQTAVFSAVVIFKRVKVLQGDVSQNWELKAPIEPLKEQNAVAVSSVTPTNICKS